MIRLSKGYENTLLEVAKLTGDTVTFSDASVMSADGMRDVGLIDVTVDGDNKDETRFFDALNARHYCEGEYTPDGLYHFVRVYTDEEIAQKYRAINGATTR